MHRRISVFVLCFIAWSGYAAETERSYLEEVVVTAERRESTVQDTAISITALSEETLQQRGIESFEDIHQHVPNFYYSEPGQAGITQIAIRGIGNENVTAAGDPGVAYHLDGVYLSRSGSALADLWDVERVEVLRGPQGTLYGRNATGGSINVITKKPGNEFDAIADILIGNDNRFQGRFAIGGAVVEDQVMVRIAGTSNKQDGFIQNLVSPSVCPSCEDMGSADSQSVRAQMLVTPHEKLEILVSTQSFTDNGLRPFTTQLLPGQRSRGQPNSPRFDSATPNPRDIRTIVEDFPEDFDLTQDVHTLRVDWHGESLHFSSLSSYSDFEFMTLIDHDNSDRSISTQRWNDRAEQWVQEFQLATNFDGPWQGILGLFYLEEDVETDYFFQDVDVFTFMNGGDYTTKSFAQFANLTYDFSQSANSGMPLRITAGLRWTKDTKKGHDFQMIPEFALSLAKDVDEEWTELTWDFVAQYDLSDDAMIYGSVSRGYKSGGLLVGNFPGEYDPESIIAYEIGAKTQFAQRYQINASAFFYDYEDLQLFQLEEFGARIENASNADVQGIEVEVLAEPVDNMLVNVQFSWLDAELDGFVTVDDIFAELGPQDLTGNRPNRAPEFSYSIGVQYTFGLGDYGSLTPRVDTYWQDETYLRPQNLDRDKQDAYHRTNARLTWKNLDEQWTAELFVTNIEDEDIVQNLALGSGSLGFPNNVTIFPPRMYGVRFEWRNQ